MGNGSSVVQKLDYGPEGCKFKSQHYLVASVGPLTQGPYPSTAQLFKKRHM